MNDFYVTSARVGLRKFKTADLDDFAAMNSDPRVMEFFPRPLTRENCLDFMELINRRIEQSGFGFWAAELIKTGELIGFVGITTVRYETEFTPAVEIGWRLAYRFWGRGLATEAAIACLNFAFNDAGLDEIVSFTAIQNRRSARVMERLGMTRQGIFDHPKVPDGHPLQSHVWYKIEKADFPAARAFRPDDDST